MATKKYLELQDFSDVDLTNELVESEAHYQKLRFDHAIKGLDNPITLKEVRRDVARLKTEMRRREVANMSEEEKKDRSKIRFRRRK